MLNHVTLIFISLGLLSFSPGRLWELMHRGAVRVERDPVGQRTVTCVMQAETESEPLASAG